jgi:orotidine-5'-phosphate decarboxylase
MAMIADAARRRMFVALDVRDTAAARALVDRLDQDVTAYKVGLELMFSGGSESGLEFVQSLVDEGKIVFLDVKLLDIPNTVESAVRNIAKLGVGYLTVHGVDRKTLDAAVKGRGQSKLQLLAVTVLTSLDAVDLDEQGIAGKPPAELVRHRSRLAKAAGFDGVIASGHEAAAVRADAGPAFLIVTPGIRRPGDASGDQARVMTPGDAIRAGASHLVVGRSITAAADPVAAAKACLADIDATGVT